MKALNIAFMLVAGLFEGIFNFIASFFPEERKTVFDADFLNPTEILSSWNKGFCLTGKQSLTIEDSTKNVLILGGTGSHKSSGILIPSLLKMRGHCSFIVNDPSGELLQRCSGVLSKDGYKIKVLNYTSPEESEGYNPLLRAKSASDIQKISKIIMVNSLGSGGKDPFWNLTSENIISLVAQLLLRHHSPEYRTLANVHHILSTMTYAPEKVDRIFAASNNQQLLSEYKAYISYGDKTLSSILATSRTAISIFGTDPGVSLITSHDTFSFDEFREQKTVLFINTSTKDMRYYSLITSIFLEQFFGHMMTKLPDKNRILPVFFLLDEASSLYFNQLQITIANLRKYYGGILQIYQSWNQLVDLYGASVAKAITENSFAKVHMPGQPIEVAQQLETTLGKFEYEDERNAKHIRSLMTANEIRESKDSIILCGNLPAIKTPTIPYFKQFSLNQQTKIPAYQPENKLPFTSVPLIEL